MVVVRAKKSILRGEHPQLSNYLPEERLKVWVGPMGSGKTTHLLSAIAMINSYSAETPTEEEIVMIPLKSPLDKGRFENGSASSIEGRLGGTIDALVTDDPYKTVVDVINEKGGLRNDKYVYIISLSDAQFSGFESIKDLIKLVKANENIFFYLEGLDLSFRGEPFPHRDFKGTMYDTIALFPPGSIEYLTADCAICGTPGATHTFRKIQYNGNLPEWVPFYDKLFRVGSHIPLELHEEDPRASGHKGEKITFNYGACHPHEFKIPGRDEWYLLYSLIKHSAHALDLNELEKTAVKGMEKETFNEIIESFQEEKIIEISDGGIYWIKEY